MGFFLFLFPPSDNHSNSFQVARRQTFPYGYFRVARDPPTILHLALARGTIVRHSMPLTPGTRLGPYEILAPLGAGGMGEVYKAKDTRLDRTVEAAVTIFLLASNSRARIRLLIRIPSM